MYSTVFWCLIVVLLVSCLALLHNDCYSLHKTKWGLVISIWQGPGPVATRTPYFRRNSNPQQIVSANSHPGDLSNFKCKLANKRVVTGTGRKPYVPRRPAQMARFDGEILKVFQADLQKRKKRFPSWPGAKKKLQWIWISAKIWHSCWSRTLPYRNDQPSLRLMKGVTVVMQ